MKSGWQTVRLDSVFDIARGGSPRPIDKFITSDPDGLNWVKISDATASGKYIERTREKIKATGLSKTRQVFPGDFLLTNSMSFGRPYIMATDGCIHDGWLVLRPRDETIVWREFFYHLLGSQAVYDRLAGRAAGSTVKNLNTDIVASIEIPLPPLNEQKRIAAILDKADALRAKRRQAIALLDSLTQSIFLEMFGDPVSNPKNYPNLSVGHALADGHILEIQDGNHGERHPKIADFSNEGIPFVTANCFRKGALNLQNAYKLPDFWLSKLRVGFAKSGDVLLTHKGTIGEAAVLSENTPHAILSPQVTYYRPGPSLNSYFLKGVFTSPSFQAILSNASEQSTRAYIGVTKQLRLPIIIPNIGDQARYAERISGVEAYARDLSRIQMQQDALFASLQHRAFTGQL